MVGGGGVHRQVCVWCVGTGPQQGKKKKVQAGEARSSPEACLPVHLTCLGEGCRDWPHKVPGCKNKPLPFSQNSQTEARPNTQTQNQSPHTNVCLFLSFCLFVKNGIIRSAGHQTFSIEAHRLVYFQVVKEY